MKTITVEQLKKHLVCEPSLKFFKRNKSTNLKVQWRRFYRAERFNDLNWFLLEFLNQENRTKYIMFSDAVSVAYANTTEIADTTITTTITTMMYKTILNYGYRMIKEQDENC